MKTKLILLGLITSAMIASQGVANQQSFVVGVESLIYFPQYSNKDGEYIGFGRELLDLFAQTKNFQFTYEIRPVQRLFFEFIERKKFDFKYPDNAYWQRKMKQNVTIYYSDPVINFTDGVLVRKERMGLGLEDLKVLGIVRGFTPWGYQKFIDSKQIKILENRSSTALLEQLIKNRIDGAYLNVSVAVHLTNTVIKRPGILQFDPGLPHINSSYFLSSIRHPELIKEFNQFLKTHRTAIEQIKIKLGILPKTADQ